MGCLEVTFDNSKTTINTDGTYTTEHCDTLTINNPIEAPSFASTSTPSGGGAVPAGTIVAWTGGYFGSGGTTGYTPVLSLDSVAAANAYLNPRGWYICNGAALNLSDSPIWNAPNRYLPNISDERFLMGSTTISSSAVGGSNKMLEHTHSLTATAAPEAAHTHSWGGHWSIDDARYVTGDNGDGSGNTDRKSVV